MLSEIVANKRVELAQTMAALPLNRLEDQIPEDSPPPLGEALDQPAVNVIAEIKYRSPSRGDFPCRIPPAELAGIYVESGAAAISVLTDETYFDGKLDNLRQVRQARPETPLLRKDFILDRYQIAEARVHGASAYLLIVACLDSGELRSLIGWGGQYGLEPLVEVHDPRELDAALEAGARIIGVNNRNLNTFSVNIRASFEIARRMEGESGHRLVSESGLRERSQLLELRHAGFSGFLIGSSLMESQDPGAKLRELLGEETRGA